MVALAQDLKSKEETALSEAMELSREILIYSLVFIIEQSRKTLIFGQLPDFVNCGIMLVAGTLIAWAGFAWFQKTRKGFSDVL